MEEQQKYVPKIIFSGISGKELQEMYKIVNRNKNISRGLNSSLKNVGRPTKISDEMVNRAYSLWKQKKITQKEIADNWGVSERTVRRRFKALED
ncbi:HTH domain-containing protein [Enterococcus sp. BWB1-3]|uniref:helix-turn-helix domain-containing protein n=1 Tax=Enterococcus sp. BWB1-3 TaxID=2787713 RepID=UPI0019204DA2|nr:HTH domain-containing protein [Enterococcus sp. BWB1-3]MBL1228020.1 HTH domain-containing protein [Enterococcus sp. BWB1-3]